MSNQQSFSFQSALSAPTIKSPSMGVIFRHLLQLTVFFFALEGMTLPTLPLTGGRHGR